MSLIGRCCGGDGEINITQILTFNDYELVEVPTTGGYFFLNDTLNGKILSRTNLAGTNKLGKLFISTIESDMELSLTPFSLLTLRSNALPSINFPSLLDIEYGDDYDNDLRASISLSAIAGLGVGNKSQWIHTEHGTGVNQQFIGLYTNDGTESDPLFSINNILGLGIINGRVGVNIKPEDTLYNLDVKGNTHISKTLIVDEGFSAGNDILVVDFLNERVGVNISNPNYELHINSPNNANCFLQFTGTLSGTGAGDGFVIGKGGANEVRIQNRDATDMDFYTSDLLTMKLDFNGNLLLGSGATTLSTKFEVRSTSGAFLPPRMTTTQKNNLIPTAGMIVYDFLLNKLQVYNGTIWQDCN